MLPTLARRNPIVVNFSQQQQHSCLRFLFFCGNSSLYLALCLVAHQPYDAGTNTCPRLATRFSLVELTLRRMPIFKRRSRASTLQILSARLSKNGTMVTFFLGYFFSSTHFHLVTLTARKVWRLCVLVFANDRCSYAGNCIRLLSNTGLFLSTGNKYLFFLQHHSFPSILDHCSCFCLASKFRNRSFWSILLFTIFIIFWLFVIDIFWWISMWYNSNTDLSCADTCILNLYRLSKISSHGIFDIDCKTSSHLGSISWILASWRVTENKSA